MVNAVWTIKAVDSDKCSECGGATETVEHFILDWPNSELCKIVRATSKSLGIELKMEITISHARTDCWNHIQKYQTEIIDQR